MADPHAHPPADMPPSEPVPPGGPASDPIIVPRDTPPRIDPDDGDAIPPMRLPGDQPPDAQRC